MVGDEYIDKILAGEARFTDAPFVRTLSFYKSLYDDGILSRKNLQTRTTRSTPSLHRARPRS